MTMPNEHCAARFRPFLEKDFGNWTPWTSECVECCLREHFTPREEDRVVGFAGEKNLQATFSYYETNNYSGEIRIWYRDDRFLKLDASHPDIDWIISGPLPKLNEPEAKLDYDFAGMMLRQGEWVFASRGLTAYLNPDFNRVVKVCVFLPTTLQRYRDEIRSAARRREFRG